MPTNAKQKTLRQQRGQISEGLAREYLEKQGLCFVEKNFRAKCGEIDLIMRDKEHLVFIEVRYRHQDDHGNGLDSISKAKQQRIIKTARHYLQQKDLAEKACCRFDAIGVTSIQKITWIKDAFQVQYR